MRDIFHIPQGTKSDVQVFGPDLNATSTTTWQVWNKPRGYSFVGIFAIGPGAGGGGGAGAIAGSTKGGGGGGGSGSISSAIWSSYFIPDTLFVAVYPGGTGGAGGSSGNGTAASNANPVHVALYPNSASTNRFITANRGALGGAGTIAAGGAGGAGGSAAAATDSPFINFAFSRFFLAGETGGGGGTTTAGTSLSIGTANQIYGGAGGGGSNVGDTLGGGFSGAASTPFFNIVPTVNGAPGGSAFKWGKFPLWPGGQGGGASNSTTGGAGGNGVLPGCGGGGGGGGTTVGHV